MQPDPISVVAGLCVVGFGLMMMQSHRVTWHRQQREFIDEPRELKHLQSRYHRRRQTSGLIVFIGVLIPLADLPLVWRQGPLLATIVWMAIGCVCLWIGLLALGDLATTKAHSRATLARLEAHKDELLGQLERLRPDSPRNDEG